MILAIDTSSALTSIALVDAGTVVAEAEHLDSRKHAEIAAPMLQSVLERAGGRPAGLRAVACGVGPGPYTGLRVGIASAIALGLAWDVPVVGLCSLDALAEERASSSEPHDDFTVAVDARRSEAYWATYAADATRIEGPMVSPVDSRPAGVIGDALAQAAGAYPHARWLARRAERLIASGVGVAEVDIELEAHGSDGSATARALAGAALLPPSPLYLRRPDAQEPRP